MEKPVTKFQPSDIPYEQRRALAARARRQTVEKYAGAGQAELASALFDQAEHIVGAGHVVLTGRNSGHVYDPESRLAVPPATGSWGAVNSRFCAHCNDAHRPILCRHKLAVWFADLLARHAPQPEDEHNSDGPHASRFTHHASRGTLGHYHGSPPPAGKRAARDGHCPYCGGFLTREGACNNCGRI